MNLDAVAFDAFGTICDIARRTHPYLKIYRRLGRRDIRESLRGCLVRAEYDFCPDEEFLADLQIELDSLFLFDDVWPVLERCCRAGLKLGVISNLAAPYGVKVRELFGGVFERYEFSYEAGAVKPQSEIYRRFCQSLNVAPGRVLMIGNSPVADVEGARTAGLQSLLLDRRTETLEKAIEVFGGLM